jgi:hypothetical protein
MKLKLDKTYRLNNGEVRTMKDSRSSDGKTAFKDDKGDWYNEDGTSVGSYGDDAECEVAMVYMDINELYLSSHALAKQSKIREKLSNDALDVNDAMAYKEIALRYRQTANEMLAAANEMEEE